MTTDEQAPVRLFNFVLHTNVPARTAEDAAERLQRALDATPEDFRTRWEPAPEETVETTEDGLESCAARFCGHWKKDHNETHCKMCGVLRVGTPRHAFEPPAPEPAGEAEEPETFEQLGAQVFNSRPPAPSSGAPGLTEAQATRKHRSRYGTIWDLPDGGSCITPPSVEAAIAAEARAPLEAKIAELEEPNGRTWCTYCNFELSTDVGMEAIRAHIYECPEHPLPVAIARAEDAERKLEKMREALRPWEGFYQANYAGEYLLNDEGGLLGCLGCEGTSSGMSLSGPPDEHRNPFYHDPDCTIVPVVRALTPPASTAAHGAWPGGGIPSRVPH